MLDWGKYHYGKKTDSATLKYDAIDTMICEYQTIVVLIGIGLVSGKDGVGPIRVALLIVPTLGKHSMPDAMRGTCNLTMRTTQKRKQSR
ncbi:MAG: hypothetical protein ACE37I_14350 [Rubinisphaera brasiliensis]|uniref:hypothetical protein n=1 Tax=Rubinisphaera brasiliensis TaxID=119 RepID=UPI00391DFC9D